MSSTTEIPVNETDGHGEKVSYTEKDAVYEHAVGLTSEDFSVRH
jgi:hypothetical protein